MPNNSMNGEIRQSIDNEDYYINIRTTADQVMYDNNISVKEKLAQMLDTINNISNNPDVVDKKIKEACDNLYIKIMGASDQSGLDEAYNTIKKISEYLINNQNVIDNLTEDVDDLKEDIQSAMHENKDVLDKLSASEDGKLLYDNKEIKITVKDQSDLKAALDKKADKTEIPTVSNDLTDELKKKYDDASDKMHDHENKDILDLLSVGKAGKLLYDGEEVGKHKCCCCCHSGSGSSGGGGGDPVQNNNEDDAEYRILLSGSADNETKSDKINKNGGLRYNPKLGSLASGLKTVASGKGSHAEGTYATNTDNNTNTIYYNTVASGEGSHAEGVCTTASGKGSHAEGCFTTASGIESHAEGNQTSSVNDSSHAEGKYTTSSGIGSHSEGGGTYAHGYNSHAEGGSTTAIGDSSHTEGYKTLATGSYAHAEGFNTSVLAYNGAHAEGQNTYVTPSANSAHAEGYYTTANGVYSHAEGNCTYASGVGSHAEGIYSTSTDDDNNTIYYNTIASGKGSHAEGCATTASGKYSHAEGNCTYSANTNTHAEGVLTTAINIVSHAEGSCTYSAGQASHTEGYITTAIDTAAHAEGAGTYASGYCSHAEGGWTTASGYCSHAEGQYTLASKTYSHAEGCFTIAMLYSHAEGYYTTASGDYSHTEGYKTRANGDYSHAEGYYTTVSGDYSHAEGYYTTVFGDYSHAEGYYTYIDQDCSHAEGKATTAFGYNSHAEGYHTLARGIQSHAEGIYTTADDIGAHAEGIRTCAFNFASHAGGKYNAPMTGGGYYDNTVGTAFVIGNGTAVDDAKDYDNIIARSNAFSVQYNGTVAAMSTITASTTADYAEFFEWKDGNPNNEDRVGKFVTIDGNKIEIATDPDQYILGIVSGRPFVLGNGDCDVWTNMYLTDDYNRYITEPVPKMELDEETGEYKQVLDENGNPIYEGTRFKLNPDYDPSKPYISRFDRKEWAPVGMLGVLSVDQDGTCEVNGYACCNKDGIATACKRTDPGAYRVTEKISDKVIKVIFVIK